MYEFYRESNFGKVNVRESDYGEVTIKTEKGMHSSKRFILIEMPENANEKAEVTIIGMEHKERSKAIDLFDKALHEMDMAIHEDTYKELLDKAEHEIDDMRGYTQIGA